MTEKYNKEQIEKLIWANPIRKVAEKMGVSDIALHKRCKRLGVVKPPPGHWAKVEHGKPVTTLKEERDKKYRNKNWKCYVKKKQNKTKKGWRIELYLGSFRTGIQLTNN